MFLTKEDLTREKGEEYVNEWNFPDHKKVGNLTIALQYRLDKRDNTPAKVNELARFQIRYWKSVEQRSKK